MNQRSNIILDKMLAGEMQRVEDLAQRFQVSERTIRGELGELSSSLEAYGLPGIIVLSNGICEFTYHEPQMQKFLDFIEDNDYYTYHLSILERKTIITMILLNQESYITVASLSEHLGISRNTLLGDLNELKIWFRDNGMELISQVRKGYLIKATEEKIREGILKLIQLNRESGEYGGNSRSVFQKLLLKELCQKEQVESIKTILKQEENKTNTFLSDYSFEEAVYEMLIILNRISKNKVFDEYYLKKWDRIQESSKYTFSRYVLTQMGNQFRITIPEVEIAYFTTCLRRKSYIESQSGNMYLLDVRILIGEMLYHIAKRFEIFFYLDFASYDILIDHLRAAIHRIRSGEILVNPIRQEIERAYPEIFAVVEEYIRPIEEYIGHTFSRDETSFVVMYFAAVLERSRAENAKNDIIPVVLVCTAGRGSAQLMLAKLKPLDHMIDVVDILSVHNIQKIKESRARMAISVVPLENLQIPYVHVSNTILNQNDINAIQNMAMGLQEHDGMIRPEAVRSTMQYEKKQEQESTKKSLTELLSRERIVLDVEKDTWEESVVEAGRLLYETGAVEERYIQGMIDNIKTNGNYIVICPGLAIPHAEEGVKEEAISIVRLKNPVQFFHEVNDPVTYVVALSVLDGRSINRAIYNLTTLFGNLQIRRNLDITKDADEMMRMVERLEQIYCDSR